MATDSSVDDGPTVDGMPRLGLGTWQNEDPEQCAESVRTALEMGYRHVDTAQVYRNEDAVGEGIARADVPREDVFLATKVWTSNLSYDDVVHSTNSSLDRLGTDYVDLLYIHWAADEYEPEDTLPAFDELYDRDDVRHVGVSNFEPEHVDSAREVLDAPVFANQVEMHPFLQQAELREYAAQTDLNLVAYSPLARGKVLENDVIADIADKHDASPAQVSLAWLREVGVTAIPKATSESHIRDNRGSLHLDLDEEDLDRIADLDRGERRINPDWAPAAWD